jgi:hypothetical protein
LSCVLQMPPLCSQSNSNTIFWLKYYNCLKSFLCCLFKPVFFHHAVLHTSQNLTLRQAYFDQEDELAFLGNFFVYSCDAVSEIFLLLPHTTCTHTCTHAHLSFCLSLSLFLRNV